MNLQPVEHRPLSLAGRIWAKLVRWRYGLWLTQAERLVKDAFDEKYYLVTYPDVVAAGEDPLLHYYTKGWREGRRPAPWFDPQAYQASAAEVVPQGHDPFQHCLLRRQQAAEHLEKQSPRSQARRRRSSGTPSPAEVEIMREGFDADYYLATYPDVAGSDLSPLMHYAVQGWREGRDPSAAFSGRYYLEAHADIRGTNPLLHYMRAGRFESWRRVATVQEAALLDWFQSDPSMQARLAEAEVLEPMLQQPVEPRRMAAVEQTARARVDVAQGLRQLLAGQSFGYVMVIPHLRPGDAARVAAGLAGALARLRDPSELLVLITDSEEEGCASWFPDQVQRLDISARVANLQPEERQRCLIDLLRGVGCAVLVNIESRLTWETQKTFGRQMAQEFFLITHVFPWEESETGARVGYPIQWLRETADQHHLILSESQALAGDLRARLAYRPEIGAAEVVVTPHAAEPLAGADAPPASGRDSHQADYTAVIEEVLNRYGL